MEKKEKKIEVTGLNLKLGDKRITLTVEQAKKLKQALDEIFEKKEVIKEIHPYPCPYPYRSPWYWQRETTNYKIEYNDNTSCQVTYDNNSNQVTLTMG